MSKFEGFPFGSGRYDQAPGGEVPVASSRPDRSLPPPYGLQYRHSRVRPYLNWHTKHRITHYKCYIFILGKGVGILGGISEERGGEGLKSTCFFSYFPGFKKRAAQPDNTADRTSVKPVYTLRQQKFLTPTAQRYWTAGSILWLTL